MTTVNKLSTLEKINAQIKKPKPKQKTGKKWLVFWNFAFSKDSSQNFACNIKTISEN